MRKGLSGRKGAVVALQWLLLGVVAIWGGLTGPSPSAGLVFWSLCGLFALGNVALLRLPLDYFYQPAHWMQLFIADTVFVAAAIYSKVGFDPDIYLPYFLILLGAGLTRSLARGALVGVGVCVAYLLLVWRATPGTPLLDASLLIRLPFFFVIALFTSYLAHAARLQQEAVDASRALAEQVTSLQQLAAGIAHEVRNPLTAISNSLQLLRGRLPAGGERELTEEALGQVQRVTRIVQETLELARPATVRAAWLNLNELLQRATRDTLRAADAESKVAVHARWAPQAENVWGDPLLIEQACFNLLRNAVEAMPGGGSLDVVTVAESVRGRDRVCVEIADTGPGIPPHQLERLFQPFYTTKAGGTGLGLALARKYVRALGGDLVVGGAPGGGTRVRILLTQAARPPAPGGAAPAGAAPEGGARDAETPAGR